MKNSVAIVFFRPNFSMMSKVKKIPAGGDGKRKGGEWSTGSARRRCEAKSQDVLLFTLPS